MPNDFNIDPNEYLNQKYSDKLGGGSAPSQESFDSSREGADTLHPDNKVTQQPAQHEEVPTDFVGLMKYRMGKEDAANNEIMQRQKDMKWTNIGLNILDRVGAGFAGAGKIAYSPNATNALRGALGGDQIEELKRQQAQSAQTAQEFAKPLGTIEAGKNTAANSMAETQAKIASNERIAAMRNSGKQKMPPKIAEQIAANNQGIMDIETQKQKLLANRNIKDKDYLGSNWSMIKDAAGHLPLIGGSIQSLNVNDPLQRLKMQNEKTGAGLLKPDTARFNPANVELEGKMLGNTHLTKENYIKSLTETQDKLRRHNSVLQNSDYSIPEGGQQGANNDEEYAKMLNL